MPLHLMSVLNRSGSDSCSVGMKWSNPELSLNNNRSNYILQSLDVNYDDRGDVLETMNYVWSGTLNGRPPHALTVNNR